MFVIVNFRKLSSISRKLLIKMVTVNGQKMNVVKFSSQGTLNTLLSLNTFVKTDLERQ